MIKTCHANWTYLSSVLGQPRKSFRKRTISLHLQHIKNMPSTSKAYPSNFNMSIHVQSRTKLVFFQFLRNQLFVSRAGPGSRLRPGQYLEVKSALTELSLTLFPLPTRKMGKNFVSRMETRVRHKLVTLSRLIIKNVMESR